MPTERREAGATRNLGFSPRSAAYWAAYSEALINRSKIVNNADVKRPLVSPVYLGLVLFLGMFYLGYLASARVGYRYKQSVRFQSLGSAAAAPLRTAVDTLYVAEMTHMLRRSTSTSLQQEITVLEQVRSDSPAHLVPLLDFELAMAHLEIVVHSKNSEITGTHLELARKLLLPLGWKDVSDQALTTFAENKFAARTK